MVRIKGLREEKGLNQQGLALKLNVSQSAISYYETGERKPDLDVLILLADFFNVSIDYLVGRTDIRNASPPNEQNANDINFYHEFLKLTPNQKSHVTAFVQGLLARDEN